MTLLPSFLITAGLFFSSPQIQTRTYTRWENISPNPTTWSISEIPFYWLKIDCGTITQGEIFSRAKPLIRDFSDSLCFSEPYTASYNLNYPSDASSEEHKIAFSTQFNIGPSKLILFTQLQKENCTNLFPANSIAFCLPLSFNKHKVSFATSLQNYKTDSFIDTSWYTDFPIVTQESCTAISIETSYKTLFFTKTDYDPTYFQFYVGGTIAEQIDYDTKGLFRIEARFKSPFGGVSAHLFSCDYGFMGSDSTPQTTTINSSIQPQIQIPLFYKSKTECDYIIINTTANISIKPTTYYANSFNTINSTLASRMEHMYSFVSFSGAIILNKKDQTFNISAQIKDLILTSNYKPIFANETTASITTSSEIQFAYFNLNPCIDFQICPSSIFTLLEQEYSCRLYNDIFEVDASCLIKDEKLKEWEIETILTKILGMDISAHINQNGKLQFSLKYIHKIIKEYTTCTAQNFPVKCDD